MIQQAFIDMENMFDLLSEKQEVSIQLFYKKKIKKIRSSFHDIISTHYAMNEPMYYNQ